MDKFFFISIILIASICDASGAAPRVIYGDDNRTDFFEAKSSLYKELAASTLAMIGNDKIEVIHDKAKLSGPTLKHRFSLCEKEKFVNQPSVASCSGFLVDEDIVATAGHCVDEEGDCANFSWVFNYKLASEDHDPTIVDASDVFRCAKIIKSKVDMHGNDFAIIRLDRPVIKYKPVKLASRLVTEGTPLVLIGHPSGLPQKIADGSKVKQVTGFGFKANLDAFQINSGSAVFNERNGELVGILVNGQRDYRDNSTLSCTEVNVLLDDEGKEGVSSVEQILPYL